MQSFILTEVSDWSLLIIVISSTFLNIYCALVNLDNSFGSPGVRPAPGLTSSTQVVCVCVHAYTSAHPSTTLTPAEIEKHTRQTLYLYPCQNIAPHASNKRSPLTSWKTSHFQPPSTHACRCLKTPVIHTHVVGRLDGTNKENAHTQVHMYSRWWLGMVTSIHCSVDITGPCIYLSALAYKKTPVWFSFPPTPLHVHIISACMQARLEQRRNGDCARSWCKCKKFCTSPPFNASNNISHLKRYEFILPTFPQYLSTAPLLLPTNPRTVRGPRASAVSLSQHWFRFRVNNPGEAPRRFKKSPCVVVEGLEAQQLGSRAPVGEHSRRQRLKMHNVAVREKRRVKASKISPPRACTHIKDNSPQVCVPSNPVLSVVLISLLLLSGPTLSTGEVWSRREKMCPWQLKTVFFSLATDLVLSPEFMMDTSLFIVAAAQLILSWSTYCRHRNWLLEWRSSSLFATRTLLSWCVWLCRMRLQFCCSWLDITCTRGLHLCSM